MKRKFGNKTHTPELFSGVVFLFMVLYCFP